jgi:hypothetical protein
LSFRQGSEAGKQRETSDGERKVTLPHVTLLDKPD